MTAAPEIDDTVEVQRLRALNETGLLEAAPEAEFDEIVRLASAVCGVPISAMTLLDRTSQFVKAAVGIERGSMPREYSFCDNTVRRGKSFTIPDTRSDIRFISNPLVTDDPHIRFYSGVPVVTEDGSAIGALCVLDTKPRVLSDEQEWSLQLLARLLSARVQLRARTLAVHQRNRELDRQRSLLRVFLDSLPLEACIKDDAGRFLFYNQALAEHFGISTEDWLGKTDHDLFDREKADLLRLEEENVMRSGQRHESYMELTAEPNGSEYWKMIKAPLRLADGGQMLSAVAINMTAELQREAELMRLQEQLEDANRKLRSLSLTDELTGLWNRRAFDARLETELLGAEQSDKALTLMLLDVDDFKSLNDTFGHPHGDEVLKQLSEVLRHAMKPEHFAARYGGEEFAIILPDSVAAAGEKLCHRISRLLKASQWKHRKVTVSIGIAMHRRGITSDDLLSRADKAMYHAKRSGKNCAMVYDEDATAK